MLISFVPKRFMNQTIQRARPVIVRIPTMKPRVIPSIFLPNSSTPVRSRLNYTVSRSDSVATSESSFGSLKIILMCICIPLSFVITGIILFACQQSSKKKTKEVVLNMTTVNVADTKLESNAGDDDGEINKTKKEVVSGAAGLVLDDITAQTSIEAVDKSRDPD